MNKLEEQIRALAEKWSRDLLTYPETTDERARFAAECLRACIGDLRALMPAEHVPRRPRLTWDSEDEQYGPRQCVEQPPETRAAIAGRDDRGETMTPAEERDALVAKVRRLALHGVGLPASIHIGRDVLHDIADSLAALPLGVDPEQLHAPMQKLAEQIARGRSLFPGNKHMLAALAEEVGELARALLEHEGRARVMAEALDVACVAMRIYLEGDADFEHDARVVKLSDPMSNGGGKGIEPEQVRALADEMP
jgi:NTP pyrophosphatase (non-canonical NTP hydrolase)